MVDIEKTKLEGVYVLTPKVFGDARGWFTETYSKRDLEEYGIFVDFVQDNRSFSAVKGIIRGLHFQKGEDCQSKLVSCLRGEILDVAVDLRKNSPTYKQWFSVVLTGENHKQLFVPKGFAHGFLTLTDDVEIAYKCDNFYAPQSEGVIRYDDPDIGVDWSVDGVELDFDKLTLSQKDMDAPYLKEIEDKLDF